MTHTPRVPLTPVAFRLLGANMSEQWRDIPGWEGLYQASTEGRIRSVDRLKGDSGSGRAVKGRIMAYTLNHKGYRTVHLSRGGTGKRVSVHRMVAATFIPNESRKEQVNHKNGIKTDNRVENLEWVTNLENMRHAVAHGLTNMAPCLAAAHTKEAHEKGARKVMRPVIRSDGKMYDSVKSAAEDMGVHHSAISQNIHGKTRTCKGYSFRFAKE